MEDPSTLKLSDTPAPRYDVSLQNLEAARAEFITILGLEYVISDTEQCFKRSTTVWSPAEPDQKPSLVLLPWSTDDVSRVLKTCHARRIPVTSYAGGTSMAGATISTRGGVCVDFACMDTIKAIHRDDMDAVVQPGVRWQQLNDELGGHGLFFPPDPGFGARVGGMVRGRMLSSNA